MLRKYELGYVKSEPMGRGLWSAGEMEWESEWRARLRDLEYIYQLHDNWDGEGAEAPCDDLRQGVNSFLLRLRQQKESPPSRIIATPDGSIVIEWQESSTYKECEIKTPSSADWYMQLPDGTSTIWEESLFIAPETWVADWKKTSEDARSNTDMLWQRQYLVAA